MKRIVCVAAILITAWSQMSAWGKSPPAVTLAASRPAAETAEAHDPRVAKEIFDDLAETYEVVVEPIGIDGRRFGEVDWTNGLVYATGSAKAKGTGGQAIAMARRAARLRAARNSMLLVGGFSTDAGGRFESLEEGRIVAKGQVRGFAEASSDYDAKTRTATVKLIAPLGGISGRVKPRAVGLRAKRWAGWGSPAADRARLIVIDARGVDFGLCAWPVVISRSDEVVFSPAKLAPGQLVSYVRMKAGAKIREGSASVRSGAAGPAGALDSRAVILNAASADKTQAACLVVEAKALKTLADHGEARRLWRQGKVVIVLGED